MPLVEWVGGLILPEECQGQNHRRKFMVLLLHRIAASLVLPLYESNMAKTSFTLVGSEANSPAPLLRPSPATGHDAEKFDV